MGRGFLVSYDEQRRRLRENSRISSIDLSPIGVLLKRILDEYQPEQVWLFGSRARGDAKPWSDWDLFVVLPDDAPEQQLDPVQAFKLQRGSGVYADVLPCRASDFRDNRGVINTICHAVATEGMLIYER
jgi:predicted nucleotidyltransferase